MLKIQRVHVTFPKNLFQSCEEKGKITNNEPLLCAGNATS